MSDTHTARPDLMGGPEPDEQRTDVMAGQDPAPGTDVMRGQQPGGEDTDTLS